MEINKEVFKEWLDAINSIEENIKTEEQRIVELIEQVPSLCGVKIGDKRPFHSYPFSPLHKVEAEVESIETTRVAVGMNPKNVAILTIVKVWHTTTEGTGEPLALRSEDVYFLTRDGHFLFA